MIVPHKTMKLPNFLFRGISLTHYNFPSKGLILGPDIRWPRYWIYAFTKCVYFLSVSSLVLLIFRTRFQMFQMSFDIMVKDKISSRYPKARPSLIKTYFTTVGKYARVCKKDLLVMG